MSGNAAALGGQVSRRKALIKKSPIIHFPYQLPGAKSQEGRLQASSAHGNGSGLSSLLSPVRVQELRVACRRNTGADQHLRSLRNPAEVPPHRGDNDWPAAVQGARGGARAQVSGVKVIS